MGDVAQTAGRMGEEAQPQVVETPEPAGDALPVLDETPAATTPAETPAAPEAAPAQPTADDPVRVAANVERARRKLREERAALDRDRAAVHAELERGRAALAAIERAKADPMAALEAGGHDYAAATKAAIDRAKAQKPEEIARAAAEEARKILDEAKAEREAARLETRVARRIADISQTIAADDRFELTRAWRWMDRDGAHISGPAMVEAVLRSHHAKTGTEMPIEEALERVESYIEKEEVPRLRNVKKLAAMFAASPAPKVPSAKPGTVQQLSDDRFSAHNGIASDADELNKIADQVARGAI